MKPRRNPNKELQKAFDYYNERFFESRLNGWRVRFGDIDDKDEGECVRSEQLITINNQFRDCLDIASIIMLHEMAHADLPDYIGVDPDEEHGMMHMAKIAELIRRGAYDNLL